MIRMTSTAGLQSCVTWGWHFKAQGADGQTTKYRNLLDSVMVKRNLKLKSDKSSLNSISLLCCVKLKVILSHRLLKSNWNLVTLNCVWQSLIAPTGSWSSGPTSACLFHRSWATQWFGWEKWSLSRDTGGLDWWPPLCHETPLSSGQEYRNANFQTISLVWSNTFRLSAYMYLWAVSLSIAHNFHAEGDIEIERGGVRPFFTLPQISNQPNFTEKPLCS